MLPLIYLVPVLICCVVGVGAVTGIAALISRRKSGGKGKKSKQKNYNTTNIDKTNGKIRGNERSIVKEKEKGWSGCF